MKRIFVFCLLLLFFSGCTQQPAETTEETTQIIETTAPGLYVEGSEIEQKTDGTLRRFKLPSDNYFQITMMGDKHLFIEVGDNTKLTILSGADLYVGTCVEIPTDVSADDAIYRVTHNGFIWYDRANKQMIVLDQQLQQRSVIAMPEDMEGDPVISDDGSEIYYCAPGQIRALDVDKGITRPIKEHEYSSQSVLSSAFGGTVLVCKIATLENGEGICYISAENGQTITRDSVIGELQTFESQYLMQRPVGEVQQILVGIKDETPIQLDVAGEVKSAVELGSVVVCNSADMSVSLELYSVTTGELTDSVSIEGYTNLQQVWADRWSRCIWLVALDAQTGEMTLLQWNPQL